MPQVKVIHFDSYSGGGKQVEITKFGYVGITDSRNRLSGIKHLSKYSLDLQKLVSFLFSLHVAYFLKTASY